MKHRLPSRRGFTLVELLVVIAIIAVLIALFIPIMSKVKDRAKDAQCMSNLKELANAAALYTADHEGKFFGYYGSQLWVVFLEPYHAEMSAVRYCPNATFRGANGWGSSTKSWKYGSHRYDGSYGFNGWFYGLDSGDGGAFYFGYRGFPENFWKDIDQAGADTPLFADCVWVDGWPHMDDAIPPTPDGGKRGEYGTYMGRFFTARHEFHSVIMSFADGHVEKVPIKMLWDKKWHPNFERQGEVAY